MKELNEFEVWRKKNLEERLKRTDRVDVYILEGENGLKYEILQPVVEVSTIEKGNIEMKITSKSFDKNGNMAFWSVHAIGRYTYEKLKNMLK